VKLIAFILNLPWTILGLFVGLISIPERVRIDKENWAIILWVKSWWWTVLWMKNARAATIAHVVLLGDRTENLDLEHELIHVEQYMRIPFVHPFLYYLELIRHGYGNNKYEVEAYRRSGNEYKIK
jgi:hypothetical protein